MAATAHTSRDSSALTRGITLVESIRPVSAPGSPSTVDPARSSRRASSVSEASLFGLIGTIHDNPVELLSSKTFCDSLLRTTSKFLSLETTLDTPPPTPGDRDRLGVHRHRSVKSGQTISRQIVVGVTKEVGKSVQSLNHLNGVAKMAIESVESRSKKTDDDLLQEYRALKEHLLQVLLTCYKAYGEALDTDSRNPNLPSELPSSNVETVRNQPGDPDVIVPVSVPEFLTFVAGTLRVPKEFARWQVGDPEPTDAAFHHLATHARHVTSLTHTILLLTLRSLESELDLADTPTPSVLALPSQKPTLAALVAACAASLGDATNRWCDQAAREKAADVLAGIVPHLVGVQLGTPTSSPKKSGESTGHHHGHKISDAHHVVEYVLGEVLDQAVRPVFGKGKGGGAPAARQAREEEDREEWRTDRPETVTVLEWCVGQVKHPFLHPHLSTLLPPLLTLLDAPNPPIKLSALRSLSHVLLNTPAATLRAHNIPALVLDAALTASTYYDHPALVSAAIGAATSAVVAGEAQFSEPYYDGLERVIRDGVLRGLHFATGAKPAQVIAGILDPAPRLLELASPFTVRHASPLLEGLHRVVQIHASDATLMDALSRTLHALCASCAPRIAVHAGSILALASRGWIGFKAAMEKQAKGTQDSRAKDAIESVGRQLRAAVSVVRESVEKEAKVVGGEEAQAMKARLAADLRAVKEMGAGGILGEE